MTEQVEPRTLDRVGPYVGLNYFAERDADVFFGRDAERKMIIGNLRASRLTLLYAESGVGKSSLLRAGVAARLRGQAERYAADEGTPRTLPVVFSAWRDDPVAGLIEAIETATRPFVPEGTTLELARDRLDEAVATATRAVDATALVMLDQFEEYFLYHSDDAAGERFADGLARCVARDDVRANFLISIREDVYSSIGDHFQARIPNVYGNYLHLDYLDRTAARQAIKQPIERLNEELPADARYDIEEKLIDDVLAEVRRGRNERNGAAGRDADDGAGADPIERFETAYLQLVMARLWSEEVGDESRLLRAETLRRLEGADSIIRSHVDRAMAELPDERRDAVAEAFRFLVTSSGRKIALSTRELADISERSEADLDPALRHLESARILRAVAASGPAGNGAQGAEAAPRWELFHDILAEPILRWRGEQEARHAQQRLKEAQDDARRAKRRSAGLLGLVVVAVALLAVAVVSYIRAVDAGHERDSQRLAVASGAALSRDPAESVGIALDGLEEATTDEAENALRVALPTARLRSVLPRVGSDSGSSAQGGGPSFVTSVSFGADDRLATGESTGRVRVWHWRSKRELVQLPAREWVSNVQLAAAGSRLLTLDSTRAALWDVDECTADRQCRPLRTWAEANVWAAAMGSDGCVVATGALAVRVDRIDGCAPSANCETPERQRLPRTREGVVWMAFARGSCVLATVTSDGEVAVWRAESGRYRPAHRMSVDYDDVKHVALSPSGDFVAVAGDLGFRVWDIARCDEADAGAARCPLLKSETVPDSINGISFAPDEERFVIATADGVARIWDLNAAEPLIALQGHRDTIFAATFSASGGQVATASADGTTRVWEASAGNVVVRNRRPIVDARFLSGGQRIVAAGEDGTVRIYQRGGAQREEAVLLAAASASDLTPEELERWGKTTAIEPLAELTASAPSPDGRWILTGDKNGSLFRWDVGRCVRRFVCEWLHDSEDFGPTSGGLPIVSIAYEPQGRLVAVAKGLDGTWILSGEGDQRAEMFRDQDIRSTGVAFSAAGDRLVTTSEDSGDARVWDVAACLTGRCVPKLLRTLRHPCVVHTATFSPDGRRLLTGCGDHIARIWTWEDEREPVLHHGHTGNIRAAAFALGGRRAVTAGTDRTTRIWDAGSGRILGVERMHTNGVRSVAVDPDDPGEAILTSSDDGTARLYECTACFPLDTLQGRAEKLREDLDREPQLLP